MAIDKMIGRRNGRLVVQERLEGRALRCLCDCGSDHIIGGGNFLKTRSCGCWQKELTSERSKTHGLSKSPEYNVWNTMITRCTNENSDKFNSYGGRGITVCDSWRWEGGFKRFIADMGRRPSDDHSIERIDNMRGYEPGNCRWASSKEQARNRRNNRVLVFKGERRLAIDVAREHGISRDMFNMRFNGMKWDILRAATQPPEERYLKSARTRKALKASASA